MTLSGLASVKVTGRWFPAPYTEGMRWGLTIAFALQAFIRGLDYTFGDDGQSDRVSSFERALPLQAWGYLFLTGFLLLTIGMVLRRQTPIWLGHSVLGTTYAAIAAGLIVQSLGAPFLDGIRSGSGLLLAAGVHTTLGWLAAPGWTIVWRKGPHATHP